MNVSNNNSEITLKIDNVKFVREDRTRTNKRNEEKKADENKPKTIDGKEKILFEKNNKLNTTTTTIN